MHHSKLLLVVAALPLTLTALGLSSLNQPTQAQTPDRCPTGSGGGALVNLYRTRSFDVYICQGGQGRQDWRELDYYGVSRRSNNGLRLRAYLDSPGFYAVNGTYRYTIDPSKLTVTNDGKVLVQEPVETCLGNQSNCATSP
jgi:hypothetical protein